MLEVWNKNWKELSCNLDSIWELKFEVLKPKTLGETNYNTFKILINQDIKNKVSEEEIKEILAHEIAHAIIGKEGHSENWKEKCKELGGTGFVKMFFGECTNTLFYQNSLNFAKEKNIDFTNLSTSEEEKFNKNLVNNLISKGETATSILGSLFGNGKETSELCSRCNENYRISGLIVCKKCFDLPSKCCNFKGFQERELPNGKKVCIKCATCDECNKNILGEDYLWRHGKYPYCNSCKKNYY